MSERKFNGRFRGLRCCCIAALSLLLLGGGAGCSREKTHADTGAESNGAILRELPGADPQAHGVPVSVHVSPGAIHGGQTAHVTIDLGQDFHGNVTILYAVQEPGVLLNEVLDGPGAVPSSGRQIEFDVTAIGGLPFSCGVAIGAASAAFQVDPEDGAVVVVEP